MERISIFDIFKVGVGPSSSHTLGPWRAGLDFLQSIKNINLSNYSHIKVHLFGSLSKTGKGHGTDIAIMLGLLGYDPVEIDTNSIELIIDQLKSVKSLVLGERKLFFDPSSDIKFEQTSHAYHPNTLEIELLGPNVESLIMRYFSIGGGFIEKDGDNHEEEGPIIMPFPIDKAQELLKYTLDESCSISEIVHKNELAIRTESDIQKNIQFIYNSMLECVYRGCKTDGILPGGLNVTRRAKAIATSLINDNEITDPHEWVSQIAREEPSFEKVNKWISCFALAVNEENASFGRVVTSPTNGAAGVIPAVLLYYLCFCNNAKDSDISKFMLTSGEIGCLFKKGATISAAVGGCQAEIGVSSAMAAAGLTEVLGGNPKQVLMAAEIAMEHHLGLTCDPIGGLVQIPCIERNAMGAMKAITASNIALSSDADRAIVSLDDVIKTMWDTAQDMNHKYKETAEGGLAFNLSVIQPSC